MDMMCPECLGPLVTTDGVTAKCTLHGGEYRILFMRGQAVAKPPALTSFAEAVPAQVVEAEADQAYNPYRAAGQQVHTCARHPQVKTEHTCSSCGVPICDTCRFHQPGGTWVCPDCVSKTRVLTPEAREVPEGVMCTRHPEVQADRYCKLCRKPVCATCDFALPGGIHVCPDCATKPSRGLSSKRKTLLVWAYVLAVWCTLGLALLLSGIFAEAAADPGSEEAFGMVFSLLVFMPSLVGTALALGTLDRRLNNPPALWIAIVWNILNLAVMILLTLIGLFMTA